MWSCAGSYICFVDIEIYVCCIIISLVCSAPADQEAVVEQEPRPPVRSTRTKTRAQVAEPAAEPGTQPAWVMS